MSVLFYPRMPIDEGSHKKEDGYKLQDGDWQMTGPVKQTDVDHCFSYRDENISWIINGIKFKYWAKFD